MDLRRRRLYKKIVYSKFTLLFLAILFILVSKAAWNAYGHVKLTRQNLERAEAELRELEDRKRTVEQESAVLASDAGIEELIRERLPVAKEGERVIIIVDEDSEEASIESEEDLSWWKSWWQKVF